MTFEPMCKDGACCICNGTGQEVIWNRQGVVIASVRCTGCDGTGEAQ